MQQRDMMTLEEELVSLLELFYEARHRFMTLKPWTLHIHVAFA